MDIVLLDGHHQIKGLTSPDDLHNVQRFNGGQMQYPRRDTLRLKRLRCVKAAGTLRASRYYEHIPPFLERVGFAESKLVVGIENVRTDVSGQPYIHWTSIVRSPANGRFALHSVNRRQDRHIWHRAHNVQILDILVCFAGESSQDTGVCRTKLYVGVCLGY